MTDLVVHDERRLARGVRGVERLLELGQEKLFHAVRAHQRLPVVLREVAKAERLFLPCETQSITTCGDTMSVQSLKRAANTPTVADNEWGVGAV